MDPITTAIIAAIAAGVGKIGEQVIVDGYGKLKELLKNKLGVKSDVVSAVEALESKPDSLSRKGVVEEEIKASNANQDAELVQAAQALLEVIKTKPNGAQIIQTAIGDQNIQVSGDRNSISVNTPKTTQ